jgi:hypothetical protein
LFPQTFRQSILKVPASLFNDIISMRRDVAGMALAGSDPLTAIARANLLLLERFAHTISPALLPAAAERAIDHLGLAMRARLDDSPIRRDRGTSAHDFDRASLYINGHLHDSGLSVERIANATGLSAGHLHEVFPQGQRRDDRRLYPGAAAGAVQTRSRRPEFETPEHYVYRSPLGLLGSE